MSASTKKKRCLPSNVFLSNFLTYIIYKSSVPERIYLQYSFVYVLIRHAQTFIMLTFLFGNRRGRKASLRVVLFLFARGHKEWECEKLAELCFSLFYMELYGRSKNKSFSDIYKVATEAQSFFIGQRASRAVLRKVFCHHFYLRQLKWGRQQKQEQKSSWGLPQRKETAIKGIAK